MPTIGIVGNGPTSNLPDFAKYKNEVDVWIGADGGALTLLHENIEITYAIGDFDSVNEEEKKLLRKTSISFIEYPSEKDESDIELALLKAYELNAKKIYLFGVTGGRLDHELVNIQLLYSITKKIFVE